jgi:hypothetical protein
VVTPVTMLIVGAGPFFGFTVAVRTSALVIGQSIRQSGGGQAPEAPETRPAA